MQMVRFQLGLNGCRMRPCAHYALVAWRVDTLLVNTWNQLEARPTTMKCVNDYYLALHTSHQARTSSPIAIWISLITITSTEHEPEHEDGTSSCLLGG